ncbi:hypothetical protein [Brevibacillus choshinensis]|uniref:hypothetical protein n=1 Tax=Brevibacillus choshinensis TaxID=54911 RepID=UPI002E1BAE09|nr:hypothetical protein [Brevibacillus choshinensis]MED4780490.1 hypothetical protein [Brevibacillus choshinensis]
MTQIQLPNHAIPISFETAMEKYDLGKKVLAILSDENGVYATPHTRTPEIGPILTGEQKSSGSMQNKDNGSCYHNSY